MNKEQLEQFSTEELFTLRNGFEKMLDEAHRNKDFKVCLFADEAKLLITSIIWDRNVDSLEEMMNEGAN
jgi:hypothetical protein